MSIQPDSCHPPIPVLVIIFFLSSLLFQWTSFFFANSGISNYISGTFQSRFCLMKQMTSSQNSVSDYTVQKQDVFYVRMRARRCQAEVLQQRRHFEGHLFFLFLPAALTPGYRISLLHPRYEKKNRQQAGGVEFELHNHKASCLLLG